MFYGLPSVDLLKEYKPKQLSKIISSDNKVLYEPLMLMLPVKLWMSSAVSPNFVDPLW